MAATTDPITHCLQRNWDMIESALAGMDDEMLNRARRRMQLRRLDSPGTSRG